MSSGPVPCREIVLDTDIGGDIDDTWALGMALRCPELKLRLVVSATADTEYRARIAARFLAAAGRSDVPVGVGLRGESDGPREAQWPWVRDCPLDGYPGRIERDGVQAAIDVLAAGAGAITLVAIGPLTNVAEIVRRAPGLAPATRLVCMLGSIEREHGGRRGAIAEWNVKQDVAAAQAVFACAWRELVIAPLDTCGVIGLTGANHRRVMAGRGPVSRAIAENYRIWDRHHGRPAEHAESESSVLFDTLAVHLAFSSRFVKMEPLRLSVTDDGFTRRDARGCAALVAMEWEDLPGFCDELTGRLCAGDP